MGALVSDFGHLVRRLFRVVRYASLGLIGVMVVLLAFRVADLVRALREVHPLLGWAFLVVLLGAMAWFVGRPLLRFWRVPVAIRPPKIPPAAERRPHHLVRHLDFVERYLLALPANPEWTGEAAQVEAALAVARALRDEAVRATDAVLPELVRRVDALEHREMERLLEPLDRKASEAIRAEALRVGITTAVSPYGTLDAFLVLWRNVNLISRIATIYYGRPGLRGTLFILRDVSVATMASAYMGDLTEVAGDMVGSLAGKTAGFFTGPLMEGCLNAVATLRIGYVAKRRCRAFQAWTERTAGQAAKAAIGEAAAFSAGLVKDVVKTVGGGLLSLTGHALGSVVDKVAGLFRRSPGEGAGEAPAGA